jgi:hypothetical protein
MTFVPQMRVDDGLARRRPLPGSRPLERAARSQHGHAARDQREFHTSDAAVWPVAGPGGHLAKVVYVDNDPTVIRHGQALLLENDRTDFAAADFTEPAEVLANPAVTGLLDLDRPVGLIQALMLHHIADLVEARAIAAAYVDALPSGSYVAISHVCNPRDGSETARFSDELEARLQQSFPTLRFRTPAEIESLFGAVELLGPGVVRLFDWWPPGSEDDQDDHAAAPRPGLPGRGVAAY